MSRTIHRLTTRAIASAKPRPGKRVMLADGGNLLLQVTGKPDGKFSRSWIFRYERDGKRHDLGLGPVRQHAAPMRHQAAVLADVPAEIAEIEPAVRGLRGLHIPESGVIDYRQVAAAYAEVVGKSGGQVQRPPRHQRAQRDTSRQLIVVIRDG